MARILLVGAELSMNRGSAGMIIGSVRALNESVPEADITLLSYLANQDASLSIKYGIRIPNVRESVVHSFAQLFVIGVGRILPSVKRKLRGTALEYDLADVILHVGGDGFNDKSGLVNLMKAWYPLVLCAFLRKPMVIYAQSIGPFDGSLARVISSFCLSHVDMIIVREKVSQSYLEKLGLSKEIFLTADSAFLLDAASPGIVDDILAREHIPREIHPVIGICPSQHLFDKSIRDLHALPSAPSSYVDTMSQIADFIVQELNGAVYLIPHVVVEGQGDDDVAVGERILSRIRNPNRVFLVRGGYSPEEVKGLIGKCDLFISGRMHAAIAAMSQGIPTIVISYSHKAEGIMQTLGAADYSVSCRDANYSRLASMVVELWGKREYMHRVLLENTELSRRLAYKSAKLVRAILLAENHRAGGRL